ncbi:hypothetical protein Taro_015189 [Colocasia esculenta]|uniref:Uncharacterized protein n=1 Tax=Colocasia esculenta TaxID=4460 RepID=A0A843ULH1_COLES|nr:hypothetical protein [Colocasia esculenta]
MARLVSVVDSHLSVSTLSGTPGYVPPEYYQSFRCSTKGDFGDNNLVGWVQQQHPRWWLADVFDPTLFRDDPSLELELLEHLKVACACLDDRPARCPTMLNVMAMFKEVRAGSTVGSTDVSTPSVDDVTAHYGVMGMSLNEEREDKYYLPAKATHLSMSTVTGTPGYVPPEYYQRFRCSTKGDHPRRWLADVFDPTLLRDDPLLELEFLEHLKVACACLDDRPA